MTDQRKISVPATGTAGKSLLERAAEGFDLKGFTPAPVPSTLPPPPANRLRRKPAEQPQSVQVIRAGPTLAREFAAEPPVPAPVDAVPELSSLPGATPAPFLEPASGALSSSQPIRFPEEKQSIDRARLRDQGLIEPDGTVTALLEEFRIVKRQLLHAARNGQRHSETADPQRVLICSPHPGEGKTFCAVNLALAIAAEKDSEVLLVDADFAKPSILTVLGLPGGRGLMDALADPTIRVEDCVIGTDIPGLWVLPAGNPTNADSEYLSSGRTAEVLDRLTRDAPNRVIIFDSPPALAASPAAELAKYAGQAVLVVRADQTGQSALEDAVSLLSDCPDIKLLLNAARFSPSGRRFGAYYGYGG